MSFDPNVSPGHGEFGGDPSPSKFVSNCSAPSKDSDGSSPRRLARACVHWRAIHMDAMRDAVSNADADQSSVDYAAIREHAIRILQMVGPAAVAAAGDRVLAHDAGRPSRFRWRPCCWCHLWRMKNIGALPPITTCMLRRARPARPPVPTSGRLTDLGRA